MEFQCVNCMHSGLLFERVVSIWSDVFDIEKEGGQIVSHKLDKTLHGTTDKKVNVFCSKCGHKVGTFDSQELALKHLLDNKMLIKSNEDIDENN